MEKKDVSEKDAKRLKEAVGQLSKLVSNSVCADCHQQRSLWASVNFGVFLCSRCAGMHRHLGVHITQVRSINLDTWTPIQLLCVTINGNMWTNSWLLSKKSPDYGKNIVDDPSMSRFIQEKYEGIRYGDNSGIMLITKSNFPYITVDKALDVFKLAMNLHRQKMDHCLVRKELIKAAGFDYSVPTHNPGNRKLLLMMDDLNSSEPKLVTQAHISGVPQSKNSNNLKNTIQMPTAAVQSVSTSNVRVANFIDIGDFGVPQDVGDNIAGIARMNLFDDVGQKTWNAPSKSASFGVLPYGINSEPAWPSTTASTCGDSFASFFNEPRGRSSATPPMSSSNLFDFKDQKEKSWSDTVELPTKSGFLPSLSSSPHILSSSDNNKMQSNGSSSLNNSLSFDDFTGPTVSSSASGTVTSNGLDNMIIPPLAPTPLVFNAVSPPNGNSAAGTPTASQGNGDASQDKEYILALFGNK
jgi:hypothetical protein